MQVSRDRDCECGNAEENEVDQPLREDEHVLDLAAMTLHSDNSFRVLPVCSHLMLIMTVISAVIRLNFVDDG